MLLIGDNKIFVTSFKFLYHWRCIIFYGKYSKLYSIFTSICFYFHTLSHSRNFNKLTKFEIFNILWSFKIYQYKWESYNKFLNFKKLLPNWIQQSNWLKLFNFPLKILTYRFYIYLSCVIPLLLVWENNRIVWVFYCCFKIIEIQLAVKKENRKA